MADRKTSPAVAETAARILAGGHPLENTQVRMAIQKAILEGVVATSPSAMVTVRVPDAVVEAIGHVLHPYFENMLTIAASAVAQADGER